LPPCRDGFLTCDLFRAHQGDMIEHIGDNAGVVRHNPNLIADP
jgi:hypothetical protein